MNEKAAQIFGRQREELIGKQLWTELPESIDRPLYKACHKAAETQQVILFEEYFASSDCWFENRIHPSKDGLSIFFRDITERKEAEEALRKSEHRFQTLAEVSPAGIFQTDSEGLTTYVNPRWCQISGMSKEEALGTGWLSAVHSEDKDTLSNGWERATGVHESSTAEYRFVRKDGTIAWVIGQAIPERNSENKLLGYIGTITDITDRKQTEDELKDSEARYRYLFEQNPAPMLIYELGSLSMLAVNDAFVAHYGYSKTEALALHLTDLYPLSEKKAIADLTKKLHGHAYVGEWHHLKKDGTLIAIEARSHEFSFEGRNSRIAVIIDVTERRQVEEALQKSEELYRTLFENTGTATVMIEENTIISLANAEFERLSQYSKQEIEGKKSWADFVFKEDLDRMREQYFRRREKRATALTQYEFRFVPERWEHPYYFTYHRCDTGDEKERGFVVGYYQAQINGRSAPGKRATDFFDLRYGRRHHIQRESGKGGKLFLYVCQPMFSFDHRAASQSNNRKARTGYYSGTIAIAGAGKVFGINPNEKNRAMGRNFRISDGTADRGSEHRACV